MPHTPKPETNDDLTAEAVVPAAICSASEEVRRMVFAFDDYGRQKEVRRIAARVKALEDALRGMRDYYHQHMISGVLYKQVEAALGEPNASDQATPRERAANTLPTE